MLNVQMCQNTSDKQLIAMARDYSTPRTESERFAMGVVLAGRLEMMNLLYGPRTAAPDLSEAPC